MLLNFYMMFFSFENWKIINQQPKSLLLSFDPLIIIILIVRVQKSMFAYFNVICHLLLSFPHGDKVFSNTLLKTYVTPVINLVLFQFPFSQVTNFLSSYTYSFLYLTMEIHNLVEVGILSHRKGAL